MRLWTRIPTMGAVFSLALILAAPRPVTAGLVGNTDTNGTLYNVDPLTGSVSDPRATGISNLVGITADSGGALYGLTSFGGGPTPNALFRIDATTGASTLVGPTGLKSIFEGDLSFDPTSGVLYGVQNVPSTGGRDLFTINTATGLATTIGSVEPTGDLSALAFDKSGHLFILDDNQNGISNLLEVNKSTASIISTVRLSLTLGPVGGMAFDPVTGLLYVADGTDGGFVGTNSLYTLNPSTGTLSLIGNTGLSDGLAGLTFTAAAVPEPSSCLLLGFGSVVSLYACRRVRNVARRAVGWSASRPASSGGGVVA